MKIIGITGGTGCGKTTALHILQELGAYCIDCDAVYHDLLETCPELRAEIVEAFPACAPGGVFDRKELGKLVFADQAALQRLTEITNGYVFAKVSFLLDEAARKGYPAAAIDAIGLLESGLTLLCHTTVAITAPREARLARLLAREPISPAYAQARDRAPSARTRSFPPCAATPCTTIRPRPPSKPPAVSHSPESLHRGRSVSL